MELRLMSKKLVPGDIDLTCQASGLGDRVCILNNSEMICTPLQKRWKFYAPVDPDFKGTMDDLKLLTCPGDGYVPGRPWCTFPNAYYYELDIYLDCSPHTIFNDK